MSEILERVAKAIELAQGNAPFYVIIRFKNKYDVMEITAPGCADVCHKAIVPYEEAWNWCEKLNGLWVAKQAIEALKGEIPYYETDKMWKELTSTEVWNLALDKILSGER